MAASKARIEDLKDKAAQALLDAEGPVHAKALEAVLGIGDGESRTEIGDQLYRAMKSDGRFYKPKSEQNKKATWVLHGRARRKMLEAVAA